MDFRGAPVTGRLFCLLRMIVSRKRLTRPRTCTSRADISRKSPSTLVPRRLGTNAQSSIANRGHGRPWRRKNRVARSGCSRLSKQCLRPTCNPAWSLNSSAVNCSEFKQAWPATPHPEAGCRLMYLKGEGQGGRPPECRWNRCGILLRSDARWEIHHLTM